MYIELSAAPVIDHPALPAEATAPDKAAIEDLRTAGFISIEFTGNSYLLTPTARGRAVAEEYERSQAVEPLADLDAFLAVLEAQAAAGNPRAWPADRPMFAALTDHWSTGGYPIHRAPHRPLMNVVPEEEAGLFAATIRSLVASEYLQADGLVSVTDLPSEVQLTYRGRSVVNDWPGAEPAELSEDLIAAIDDQEQNEPEPKRKRVLEAVATTIKETGVATVSETPRRSSLAACERKRRLPWPTART